MNRFISLSIVIVFLAVSGCRSAVVEQVESAPLYAPSGSSLEQVRTGIVQAGGPAGWKMVDIKPGHMVGEITAKGKHTAMVDILYDTKSFSILYKDSVNLKYTGRSIHKRYVVWVRQLRSSIQTEMRRLSPGLSPPLESLPIPTEKNPTIEAAKPPAQGGQVQTRATGTGFVISANQQVLTNSHVVDGCAAVMVDAFPAKIAARDKNNDLALLQVGQGAVLGEGPAAGKIALFRAGAGVRLGEDVVIAGFPLQDLVTSELSVTKGSVSALAGPQDDRRYIQISAPVQPGNSGGPAFDDSGNVIGVVSARLNEFAVAEISGSLPQNINFALSRGTVQAFLDSENVPYETKSSKKALPTADIAEQARGFTVFVECLK